MSAGFGKANVVVDHRIPPGAAGSESLPRVWRANLAAWTAVIVRRAEIEDADAMASIIAAIAEEGLIGSEPPVDVVARAQRFRETVRSDGRDAVWVLDHEGQVVGHVSVIEGSSGVLHLGMAILPQARGQGGGRALLEAVTEHAQACGAHKIDLEVWVDNARAIALYISTGFEVEGTRRDHYRRRDGRLRSALLMSRYITSNFTPPNT